MQSGTTSTLYAAPGRQCVAPRLTSSGMPWISRPRASTAYHWFLCYSANASSAMPRACAIVLIISSPSLPTTGDAVYCAALPSVPLTLFLIYRCAYDTYTYTHVWDHEVLHFILQPVRMAVIHHAVIKNIKGNKARRSIYIYKKKAYFIFTIYTFVIVSVKLYVQRLFLSYKKYIIAYK